MPIIITILFWLLISLSILVLTIALYSSLIFSRFHPNIADHYARPWSKIVFRVLKHVCGVNFKIINQDKIPKTPCIIACKHQSMWETAIFHLVCRYPVYIYKQELLKVPFYGWFVRHMSGVKVDREGKASALKELIKNVKKYLQKGQYVVIFPQGTRVPVDADPKEYPYQVGTAALYLNCNVPVVPAALNSGLFWPKSKFFRKRGTITLEFLDPIEPGLKKEEFMRILEERIESRSNELKKAA